MTNRKYGVAVLLMKLGPKLLVILTKLQDAIWTSLKSLVGIKGVGLAGSVGLYTYLMTWQMGVALVAFIGIHEYGHLWAMKDCNVKTRGMFFMPGFGAVAVAEERFRSARNEAYIALMGPVFGLVIFVLPFAALYYQMNLPILAAIAAFMAFINLINLLPINPLDGGRVLKALAYSNNYASSLAITVVISVITALLGLSTGFTLLAIMALIGFAEITSEFGIKEHVRKFMDTMFRAFMFYLIWSLLGDILAGKTTDSWFLNLLFGALFLLLLLVLSFDIIKSTKESPFSIFSYPWIVLKTFWEGVREISQLRAHHIKPIENYDHMIVGTKTKYAAYFVVLVFVHVALIYTLGMIPGAEVASKFLE